MTTATTAEFTPFGQSALHTATLCEAFQTTVAAYPDQIALRTPGDAFVLTWEQYAQRVRRVAAGLAALGVRRGDTVGLMLTNRPEFYWVDLAVMHLGAIAFSVYNTFAPEQVEHVLRDAGCSVVIIEQPFTITVLRARSGCPRLEHVVSIDRGGGRTLDQVQAVGDPQFDLAASWRSVRPDDVVSLIYTSGTTGPPKAVQLTHAGVLANARALCEAFPAYRQGFCTISYLPLAHVIGRVLEHYFSLTLAGTLTCCNDPQALPAVLAEVRPTLLLGPPRIWEKIKAGLDAAIAADPDEQRRRTIEWAIDVGLRRVKAEQAGQPLSTMLLTEHDRAERLVLSSLRAHLGLERLEGPIVGAAPTPREVIEFFWAIGVPLCEGYGLSETLVATLNPPKQTRISSVGPPVPGVELRLADDGEILLRGPSVTLGYRNLPQQTAAMVDTDGWLHTGDIGTLDEAGYLTIIDRKKEMIINADGHNMSPATIEARLKASTPLIGQAMCIGDRRPFNVGLFVLDYDAATAFAARHHLPDASLTALAQDPRVLDEISTAVTRANARLSKPEQIQRWTLLGREWLPGGDELTPTMKLRRKPIAEKYATQIGALYAHRP
jgi:long-chain acyl-CoA synthetase